MTNNFTGCWPVAPTPFKENEDLDLEGMKRVLDCMIDQKVDGICILNNWMSNHYFQARLPYQDQPSHHIHQYVYHL